jgi:ZIP family zinc transporter
VDEHRPQRLSCGLRPVTTVTHVGAAAFWAAIGASALIVGALVGFFAHLPVRVVGLVMGFGAGTLLSAVSFDLVLESYVATRDSSVVIGLIAGAVVFWSGDWLLERRTSGQDPVVGTTVSGPSLVLGATLDGIPESVAIGLTLLGGDSVSAAMVVAVFLSNIPEGMAASIGLRHAGHSRARILWVWAAVVAMSVAAAAIGYGLLGGASDDVVSAIQAFAAGSILAMLANTMMPEAYQNGGREVGLVTVLGFIAASAIATIG